MIPRRESAESAADLRASDRSPPKAYWAVRRGGRREKLAKMQCYLRSQQREKLAKMQCYLRSQQRVS
jgi:hypothetical protein